MTLNASPNAVFWAAVTHKNSGGRFQFNTKGVAWPCFGSRYDVWVSQDGTVYATINGKGRIMLASHGEVTIRSSRELLRFLLTHAKGDYQL